MLAVYAALLLALTAPLAQPLQLISSSLGGHQSGQEDSGACGQYCSGTYAPHTSPHSDSVSSCQRGCRMFQVILFTTRKNSTLAHQACDESCAEGYPTSATYRDACRAGCQHQAPLSSGGSFEVTITGADDPMYKYAKPFMDRMMNSMSGMRQRFSSSFNDLLGFGNSPIDKEFARVEQQMEQQMNQMMAQNGKLFGESNSLLDQLGLFGKPVQKHEEKLKGDPGSLDDAQKSINPRLRTKPPSPVFGKPVGNTNDHGQRVLYVVNLEPSMAEDDSVTRSEVNLKLGTIDSLYDKHPHDPSSVEVTRIHDPADSWMSYLAHRTGRISSMTRWLLFLAMTLCIISMIWICLAIMKTAPIVRAGRDNPHKIMLDSVENGGSGPLAMKPNQQPLCVETPMPTVHSTSQNGVREDDKAGLVDSEHEPPTDEAGAPPPYSLNGKQ